MDPQMHVNKYCPTQIQFSSAPADESLADAGSGFFYAIKSKLFAQI